MLCSALQIECATISRFFQGKPGKISGILCEMTAKTLLQFDAETV
jgi:hypothetical protein